MEYIERWSHQLNLRQDVLLFILVLCSTYFFAGLETIFLKRSRRIRSLYHVVVAMFLGYVCYGFHIIHSVITITMTYLLLYLCEMRLYSRQTGLILTFTFVFGYLLVAYIYHGSLDYAIDFTFPQCMLTLKLIGFAFDYYDGRKVNPKGSNVVDSNFKPKPIRSLPPLIDYLGFASFYPTFFVGPVYTYEEYHMMIRMDIKNTPSRLRTIVKLIALSIFYLVTTTLGTIYFPKNRIIDSKFRDQSLIKRHIYFWLSYRFVTSRYLGTWLLVEGASVLAGAGYSQVAHNWRGWTNIHPILFEFGLSIRHMVNSFNIRTNAWSKYYIFKRLKFLGNKQLSTLFTLMFLAIWHGFWPGYFISFAYEFLCLYTEQRLLNLIERIQKSKFQFITDLPLVRFLFKIFIWYCRTFAVYYAVVSLDLLILPPIYQAYRSLFFMGHLLPIGTIMISFLVS